MKVGQIDNLVNNAGLSKNSLEDNGSKADFEEVIKWI